MLDWPRAGPLLNPTGITVPSDRLSRVPLSEAFGVPFWAARISNLESTAQEKVDRQRQ